MFPIASCYRRLSVTIRVRCRVSYTARTTQGLQVMGVIKRYSALVCGQGGGLGAGATPAPLNGASGKGNASVAGGAACVAAASGALGESAAKRQKM